MQAEKVILTGPTGAIGTALIEELTAHGYHVIAVVHKDSKRKQNIPKSDMVDLVECNLDQLELLPQLCKEADAFIHLGWDGTFGNARNNMDGQLKNIEYTLQAVDIAHALGCKLFLGAGSQAEYGRHDEKLSAENPCFPENGYGIAKLAAGQMTRIKCREYGMQHIWLRILSVYGPCDGPNTLISSLISRLQNGIAPETTAGEQIWDYIYSRDAARAIRLLIENAEKCDGKIYPIGSGQPRQLREYMEAVRTAVTETQKGKTAVTDITGEKSETVGSTIEDDTLDKLQIPKIHYGAVNYAPNQVMHLVADISQLTADTGFLPAYTFEDGLKDMLG